MIEVRLSAWLFYELGLLSGLLLALLLAVSTGGRGGGYGRF